MVKITQPAFMPEPPPWLQEAGVDYFALLLMDLKIDCPKDDIRNIFVGTGTEIGGQGPP